MSRNEADWRTAGEARRNCRRLVIAECKRMVELLGEESVIEEYDKDQDWTVGMWGNLGEVKSKAREVRRDLLRLVKLMDWEKNFKKTEGRTDTPE